MTGRSSRSRARARKAPIERAMSRSERAAAYNAVFPDRPSLGSSGGWVSGTWLVGNDYRNRNAQHGAYPHGYLRRVHAMFPDAANILHAFSGGLTRVQARSAAHEFARTRRMSLELVDLRGPEEGCDPTWQGDVLRMPDEWTGRFDLILADPPYSPKDAAVYGTPMPNRAAVTRALHRVCRTGGSLVWLDQVWPMHRKVQWRCWAQIGLVRSTNHRVRLVSMFEARNEAQTRKEQAQP